MGDSTPCGTVRVTDDGLVYGLSAFQQVSGCDPGDVVLFLFNLTDRVVTLVPGDDELLDRFDS